MTSTSSRHAAYGMFIGAVIALALAATACASGPLGTGTTYRPQGWTGGYDKTQLTPNVFGFGSIADQYTLPCTATDSGCAPFFRHASDAVPTDVCRAMR